MFKPWDKVRCIEAEELYDQRLWDILYVYEVLDKEDWLQFISFQWQPSWYYPERRFELVKEEDSREPKQGDIVDVRMKNWKVGERYEREFICTVKWKHICRMWVEAYAYDQIRPIQPKDTLQSVYSEMKERMKLYKMEDYVFSDIIKRMEPFIS